MIRQFFLTLGLLIGLAVPAFAQTLIPPAGGGGAGCTTTCTYTGTQNINLSSTDTVALGSTGYSVTGTGSSNWLSMTGTWNTSGSPNLMFSNMTCTSCAGANFINFQRGGTSQFSVSSLGRIDITGPLVAGQASQIGWNTRAYMFSSAAGTWELDNNSSGTESLWLSTVDGNGTVIIGKRPSATPVARVIRGESSIAGTSSNVGGANVSIGAGIGTGTGTLATLALQAPVAVASGTGAQTQTTGLTIIGGAAKLASYTVATLPACATVGAGSLAWVTDATAPTFNGTLTGGGAVGILAGCDGTNWHSL